MNLKLAAQWLVTAGVILFAGAILAQGVPTVNNSPQTPAVNKPQSVARQAGESGLAVSAPETAEKPTVIPAKNQPDDPTIQSRKDKISYAFGVDLARDLKQQKNDLNVDLLMRALRDSLADKPLIMTDDEVTATLKQLQQDQKQDYEHARMMVSDKNKRAGDAFFSENAKKEGVVTLPSGLQYKILKKGDGKFPALDDRVVCQYRATLLDGTEFDSSEKRGHPVTLPVKGIMAGWTQALQMMSVGSKWQLFIPPQLAYGEKIVNGIGPNAMLVFDVELLSIQDKTQTASAAK